MELVQICHKRCVTDGMRTSQGKRIFSLIQYLISALVDVGIQSARYHILRRVFTLQKSAQLMIGNEYLARHSVTDGTLRMEEIFTSFALKIGSNFQHFNLQK